ncbi:MAG: hypothetical protein QNK05_05300 [Myxococcota bacterium]|nr:hypothetical protein [Myxococcota bacterium]
MRAPSGRGLSRLGIAWLASLVVAGLGSPGAARELWRDGERSLEFRGSVRQIVNHTRATDASQFAEAAASDPACLVPATFASCAAFDGLGDKRATQGLTRLRLRLDATFSDRISARVDWDNEFLVGTLGTLFGEAGPADTFFGWEEEIHAFGLKRARDHRRWTTRIYRGFVTYEGERLELRLGRQLLAWGTGRIWNPTNRLTFVPPLSIEADQALGVDSLDARWRLSGFSYVQAVYAPGNRSDEARMALRWQGVVRDVDLSGLVGVFEEAPVVGFDLATNLGDAALRVEAAWTDPEKETWPVGAPAPSEPDAFLQLVVSADINFDIGNGIYALVEHLYNGNALGHGRGTAGALLPFFASTDQPPPSAVGSGLPGPFVEPAGTEIFATSLVVSGSEHLTAFQLGYEPTAALATDLLVIWDWDGSSVAFFPQLRFTGFDTVELSLGAQLFVGPRHSEYGDRQNLVFVQAELFF